MTPSDLLGPLNEVEQKNAPKELFFAGDRSILDRGPRVSIVGSRKASPEGLQRARKLSRILVEHKAVVVSGLAEGIDTQAHTTAMQHGGRTIAVIGTPLDEVFPKKNAELQREIAKSHLVVSQFRPGVPVQRHNFPMRNRTMALLSDATVIIEASDKSGSLSQAWEALRLGRSLFITNGAASDKSLSWPAELINYGAIVLSDDNVDLLFEVLPERNPALVDDAIPF